MLRLTAVTAMAAAVVLSACAAAPAADKSDAQMPVYRTGSNIPLRDSGTGSRVQTVDPETVQRMNLPSMPSSRGSN